MINFPHAGRMAGPSVAVRCSPADVQRRIGAGGFSSEVDMKWKDGTPKSQGNAFTSWQGKGSRILNDNASTFKQGMHSYEGWKSRATTEFKKSPGDNVLEEIRQLRHGGAYSKAKKDQK